MPGKNRNGLPAYQRIQSAIRKRIDGGHLHPGDAVASERDLAKIHQVSLMTARHALASLEREGIVERRRGVGTFVAAPKIHFNKLMSYTEQMSSRSLTVCLQGALRQCWRMKRRRPALSLRPAAFSNSSVCAMQPANPLRSKLATSVLLNFRAFWTPPIGRESLFGILERNYNIELGYSDEEIDATAADPRIAEILSIPLREPLLRIRQVIYSTKGKAIMYVRSYRSGWR